MTGSYVLACTDGGPFLVNGAAGTAPELDGKSLRDILLTVGYHVSTA